MRKLLKPARRTGRRPVPAMDWPVRIGAIFGATGMAALLMFAIIINEQQAASHPTVVWEGADTTSSTEWYCTQVETPAMYESPEMAAHRAGIQASAEYAAKCGG